MTRIIRHIKQLLLGMIVFCAASCDGAIELFDKEECDYSVRIFYHYNRENTSRENLVRRYVKTLEAYIFDGNGVLYAISPVEPDPCDGYYVSELDLPPGRYSIIAIGNRSSMSKVVDGHDLAALEVGVTHRDDVLLTLENTSKTRVNNGCYENTGRLFHGYRTFTVTSTDLSHIRVDMVHSHCVINYTIEWVAPATPPTDANGYYVQYADMPSRYAVMPEYYFPGGWVAKHEPNSCDPYNSTCLATIHHIPTVYKPGMVAEQYCNIITHRIESYKVNHTIRGETITYRLRNEGDVMFSLHNGNDGQQIMKNININQYFQDIGHNLDHSLRQEYSLNFRIHADGGVKITTVGISEWDEGGNMGGH